MQVVSGQCISVAVLSGYQWWRRYGFIYGGREAVTVGVVMVREWFYAGFQTVVGVGESPRVGARSAPGYQEVPSKRAGVAQVPNDKCSGVDCLQHCGGVWLDELEGIRALSRNQHQVSLRAGVSTPTGSRLRPASTQRLPPSVSRDRRNPPHALRTPPQGSSRARP